MQKAFRIDRVVLDRPIPYADMGDACDELFLELLRCDQY